MPAELFQSLILKDIISVQSNRLMVLNEVKITSYGSKAWADTLQQLGLRKGKAYLEEIGHLMGSEAAREMNEVLKKKKGYVPPGLADINNIIQICGFGVVSADDISDGIRLTVQSNHIIQYGKELFGKESIVCSFYSGVYLAFFEEFNGKPFTISHEQCINEGHEKGVFTLRPNAR